MSKIHDHFSFPLDLDMSPYVSTSEDAPGDSRYVLHSILVHGGDVGGGHYYALICVNGSWYKFDDEVVLSVPDSEAIWMHYGRRKYDLSYPADLHTDVSLESIGGGVMSTFSAYMLVYVRRSDFSEIMRPISSSDIPSELTNQIEEEERKAHRQELIEMHLKVNSKWIVIRF